MSEEKEALQQQVLFDDSVELKVETSGEKQLPEQQVILPEEAFIPVVETPIDDVVDAKVEKPRWLWRIAGVSFGVIVIYELIDFLLSSFAQSPLITGVYALLFGSVVAIASLSLVKELLGLRQYRRQQHSQHKASKLLARELNFDAAQFCQNIGDKLPSDSINEQHNAFFEHLTDDLSEQEIVTLYSNQVLSKVDEQALSQIAKFSTEAVVLVAVSPVAIIDMMVLMWRNLRMIDKIAGLYGIRLGYWSRIKLIRQVFTNMVYAGASEIIADVGVQMLGMETLGKLSTRAAQGLGAGMLTAKLGIKTITLCRPIPFTDNAPGIAKVRKQVINQVKGLLSSSSST